MKNKKIIICLVSAVSLLGTLVGCGGESSSTTPSNSTTPDTSKPTEKPTEPTNPDAPKHVEVVFWHTFGQGIVDELNSKVEEFHDLVLQEENIDVHIDLQYQGGYPDINRKILQGFSAANIPTIAVAYPDHVADYLDAEGKTDGKYVVNLDTLINDPEIGYGKEEYLDDTMGVEDFIPSFYEEGQQYAKEGTFSIPLMKSSEVMFYNKPAAYAAVGLYKPELAGKYTQIDEYLKTVSWDEFMAINKVAVDNKAKVLPSMEVPAYYDSDANLFISKMFQENIPFSSIKEDGEGVIDFESGENLAKAKDLVKSLKTYYDQKLFFTKGVENQYGSNFFTEAKSIFSIGSTGGTGYTIPQGNAFEVGVAKVPASNDNPLYVTQGPTVTMLKNPGYTTEENDIRVKYGWKFIKYLTTPQVNLDLCIRGSEGYAPVRATSYELDDYLAYLESADQGYADALRVLQNDIGSNYLNTKVFKGSTKLREQSGALITQVMNGDKTIDQAFTDLINNVKKELGPLGGK